VSGSLERMALIAGIALATTAAWTGAPLFAVWVGSKAQGNEQPTMGAIAVVIGVLAVVVLGLLMVLTRLNQRYDRVTGRPPPTRRPPPWMSSMRGERQKDVRMQEGISGAERTVAICCAAGLIVFEVWFFFFSGSSLPAP
jgi:hypothetical protein